MEEAIRQVLDGGLGYFWLWERAAPSLEDDDARAGFVREREGAVEVHLLVDDVVRFNPFEGRAPPVAILGATEHTGVLILDMVSRPAGRLSFGGSRVSDERYLARTMITSPEALDATRPALTQASVYLYGEHLLRWSGFEPVTRTIHTDPATNRIRSARIDLAPVNVGPTSLRGSGELMLEPHWNVRNAGTQGLRIDLALELGVRVKRARPSVELLEVLVSVQTLLSAVFEGFVRAGMGRALVAGLSERGFLWNSVLMPEPAPPRVRQLPQNPRPLVTFDDLGGAPAIARWIRLTKEHPRAVAPIHNRWRRGRGTDEQQLIDCAVAIEYWVAAHRRTARWASAEKLQPLAAANHVGSHFDVFVGDSSVWADRLWRTYNGLKHDPGATFDLVEVGLLAETGYLLLLCLMLDRVATTKAPSRTICRGHPHASLGEALRLRLGT